MASTKNLDAIEVQADGINVAVAGGIVTIAASSTGDINGLPSLQVYVDDVLAFEIGRFDPKVWSVPVGAVNIRVSGTGAVGNALTVWIHDAA